MAITFPTSGSTGSVTSTSSVTSGSFSPGANTLLIAFVWATYDDTVIVSNSKTARTWTLRGFISGADNEGYEELGNLYIFTAPNPTAQTSITVTASGSFQGGFAVKPVVAAGVDLANPVGDTFAEIYETGSSSFNRNTVISSVNNSRSVCIALNWFDSTEVGSSDGVFASFANASLGSGIALSKTATPTSGTTVSFNFTSLGGAVAWSIAAIELLPESVAQSASPLAITSGETFGTSQVNLSVPVDGIPSGESLGSPQLNLTLSATGIASEETFGTAIVGGVGPFGIESGESFGLPTITYQQTLGIDGIPSEEAVSDPESVFVGYPQDLSPEAIESLERVWEPRVRLAKKIVLRPPTIQETPAGPGVFFSRFGIHRGISILKRQDGSFYTTRFPAQTELEEVARYYLGGYVWPLTVEEMQDLTEAGYGEYITLDDNDE